MPLPLFLIPALISAASTAAGGIASGIQSHEQSEANAKAAAADRELQQKLARMQIMARQEQQTRDQAQASKQLLAAVTQGRSDLALDTARRGSQASGDAMSSIMRAYARKQAT